MEKAQKKLLFSWEGTNRTGAKVRGETRSISLALAKAELRRQGINPTKVAKKSESLFGKGKGKKKITASDIAIFSRQMATMMSSGVPLVQSFEIIGRGHENPAMSKLILDIKADIEGGSPLAQALGKHPLYFDDLYCNLVNAGEQAGILDNLLDKIATYKEKTEALKSKIKKATFYPIAVIVVAFIVTTILMLFVIPQFQEMFSNFGADLPAMTLMVVAMSKFFQAYWWVIFGGIGGAIYAFIEGKRRSRAFRDALDRLALKMPVFGNLLNKAA
ncbi:MAG: type II secretion system F family protein, partial [Chromatiales bacterium]|nr:type II secretion system F family protein [Chromatiales bacterium]